MKAKFPNQSISSGLHEHKARKRFGQNFLTDYGIIREIVRSIHPQKDDLILEIGPGKGAITELLADSCENLKVIELDRDLVPWLKVKFEHHSGFELFQADALEFDFSQLVTDKKLRVVGNLPYNISTPLIFHLLRSQHLICDMHFMLQKEVVQRLAAQVGDSAYGRLGIMVQYYCAVENLFEVPPTAFEPAPKVDSAIVRLVPHAQLPFVASNIKGFEMLVNTAFQQRRKTLRNALKNYIPENALTNFPLDLSQRAEEVSLADFVTASNYLESVSIL